MSKALTRAAARILDDLRVAALNRDAHMRRAGMTRGLTLPQARELRSDLATAMQIEVANVHRLWTTTPTVCAMHPDMVAELAEFQRGPLPAQLFDNLIYENPLIVFPEPIPCLSPSGEPGQMLACYVSGLAAGSRRLVSTGSPERATLRLTAINSYPSAPQCVTMLSLHTEGGVFDSEASVEQTARRHAAHDEDGRSKDQHLAAARSKLLPILDCLTYLCLPGKAIDTQGMNLGVRGRATQQVPSPAPEAPLRTEAIGWREGPAMRALRANYDATRSLARSMGKTYVPHPRRGYFGNRWCGEGRTELVLTLVRPTYIHRDLVQSIGVPTIIDAMSTAQA